MKLFIAALTTTLLLSSAFAEQNHESAHSKGALTLNHGKKWPVDQVMKENMQAIRHQFKIFSALSKAGKSSEKDAREFHAVISTAVQNIASKCKMEPMQDKTFHVILADLLAAGADLEKKEKENAAIKGLDKALNLYTEYFDHSFSEN